MFVVCFDDTNKPNEIKSCNWVKKGEKYTPVKLLRDRLTGQQCLVIEELTPDSPYNGYKPERFGYKPERLEVLFGLKVEFIEQPEKELQTV